MGNYHLNRKARVVVCSDRLRNMNCFYLLDISLMALYKEPNEDEVVIVYRTVHIPTGQYYIGVHKQKKLLMNDGYLGSGKELKKMLKLFPKTDFSRETLFSTDNYEEAFEKEFAIVDELLEDPLCLNLLPGGGVGPKDPAAAFTLISKQRKALWRNPDYREKRILAMSGEGNPFYGKTHSEETKRALSKKAKDQHATKTGMASPSAIETNSKKRKGQQIHSDEYKERLSEKMSEGNLNGKMGWGSFSDEMRAIEIEKRRTSFIKNNPGKNKTDETRQKMSEARKGRKFPAKTEEEQMLRSDAGKRNMHIRWHVSRNLKKEDCDYCED